MQPTSYMEISRVHRLAIAKRKGSLVVTSTKNGEGATLLAHILAQRSAEKGNKTLLIDLNMRGSHLSDDFAHERTEWNLDTRKNGDMLNDLYTSVKKVENLSFMPAPRDHASIEFLKDSVNARVFFETLEKQFDHVIVDTTPVGQMNRYNADPVLLAAAATSTILVVKSGSTYKDQAIKAKNLLEQAGANILGLTVNNQDTPPKKEELLNFIGPLKKINVGLHSWLSHKIMNSNL